MGETSRAWSTRTCAPLRIYRGVNRLIYGKLIRALYRKADSVVALSEGVRKDMIETFGLSGQGIKVIYNSIDLDEIDSLADEPVGELPGGWTGPLILSAGRLVPQKNQELLIRAFRTVRDGIDARLAILGTGPLEERLRRLSAELGLAEDVWFLGWKKNPFKYMRRASLFVLSSNYEGLGNVIIEALACRCPVVSTACPYGPDEILREGKGGILVPLGDAEALARAMARLLDNEAARMELVRGARERAETFAMPRIAVEYERLLESLAASCG